MPVAAQTKQSLYIELFFPFPLLDLSLLARLLPSPIDCLGDV